MNDTERLIIINMVEDIGSVRTQALLRDFGSLEKVFSSGADEISRIKEIGPIIGSRVPQAIKEIDLKKELGLIKKHGVKVITFLDKDYPENLKNIYDPPVILYVKGKIKPEDDIALAIVGSRLASIYGMQTAERLGFELASRGITIVSGLARGIDSAAHKGALKAKGRTLAILGSGLLNIYPKEHALLATEISERGAVISEFPMATIPDRGNFPKRNRVISGMSLGVVVVEASEKSGALITSDFAAEQGREVFSVPGKVDSVTSRGTNRLIKQGAKLAENADDVIEELNIDMGTCLKGREKNPPLLDKEEILVYTLLSSEPQHIDGLSEGSGLEIKEASRVLLNLEMKRFARQLPGKNFVKI